MQTPGYYDQIVGDVVLNGAVSATKPPTAQVALLPIGPFDGHDAWRVIRRTRNALRRSRVKRPPPEPERVLSPEEQRALEESSQRTAGELIDRLSRRTDAPTQER